MHAVEQKARANWDRIHVETLDGLDDHLREAISVTAHTRVTGPVSPAATGELIRHLTIDPTRDYQPRGVPCGRPRKKP